MGRSVVLMRSDVVLGGRRDGLNVRWKVNRFSMCNSFQLYSYKGASNNGSSAHSTSHLYSAVIIRVSL
ncbi:unnamed protein product [Heterobilharzia americana]|nr:unnamed protein product [Heterobilharzia americana]